MIITLHDIQMHQNIFLLLQSIKIRVWNFLFLKNTLNVLIFILSSRAGQAFKYKKDNVVPLSLYHHQCDEKIIIIKRWCRKVLDRNGVKIQVPKSWAPSMWEGSDAALYKPVQAKRRQATTHTHTKNCNKWKISVMLKLVCLTRWRRKFLNSCQ